MKPALNIHGRSPTPLAAALSLDTQAAKAKGILQQNYNISFKDTDFLSAIDAYQHFAQNLNDDSCFDLMIQIFIAKLSQHPILLETITLSGGINWLKTCSHQPIRIKDDFWTGTGYCSGYITALISAYRNVAKPKDSHFEKTKTEVNQDLERQNLSKYASYDPVSQQLYILFQNKIKAREWGQYINKKLYVGEGFSIEDTDKLGWKFELVIPLVDNNAANVLAEIANFGCRPHSNNPREPT